jgi:endoribonuclease Dicer
MFDQGDSILTFDSTLEALLDSKIVTTKSMSLDVYAPKAAVVEWEYDRLLEPFETALFQQLSFCQDVSAFDVQFKQAKKVSASLGSWCSDQIWRYALEEQQFDTTLRKYERLEPDSNRLGATDKAAGIEKLKRAQEIVRHHHFPEPAATRDFLSSKVLLLYQKLCEYFEGDEKTKCLIFVEERITARVLHDVFRHLNVPHLRPDKFLGIGGNKSGQGGITGPQVRDLKENFDAGFVNCLFCTSVAEEGIDSPACNLVIRFDLYNTMIQFVQSRGRARARGSVYGQMIERGNTMHKLKIEDARYHELQLKQFLSDMDEDRFLENEFLGIHGALSKQKPNKTFGTSAGKTCNYRTSILCLSRYASSLQYESHGMTRVVYEAEIAGNMFKYRTILPDASPLKGATGEPFPNKTAAKKSAAWETCYALRARGLLDPNLNSFFVKQRPANANARLAVSAAKKDAYDMLVKPQFWTMECGRLPAALFVTIIHLTPSADLKRPHNALVLLTRCALPDIPRFPVYLDGNIQTEVAFVHHPKPYAVQDKLLECLTRFTLQVFQDLFNKEYEADDTQMSYWLAPTKWVPGGTMPQDLGELFDLDVSHTWKPVQWSQGSDPDAWCDGFLIDKWSGKYRYWSRAVLPNLNIDSPVSSELPDRRYKGTKAEKVLEYTSSLFGKSRLKFLENCDRSQPVIGAELVQIRRNFLDRANAKEFDDFKHEYHVCPEPLALSQVSPKTTPSLVTNLTTL